VIHRQCHDAVLVLFEMEYGFHAGLFMRYGIAVV
jgi:hypothetical protein